MSATSQVVTGQMVLAFEDRVQDMFSATLVEHGYTDEDGDASKETVRQRTFEIVSHAVVESRQERRDKAITRGTLFAEVFPRFPAHDQLDDQDDPVLSGKVWSLLDQLVWTAAKADHSGYVQRQLEPLGLVLCRTEIGNDRQQAVYVTRDLRCISEDLAARLRDKAEKAAKTFGRDLNVVMERFPEHARALDRQYRTAMRRALEVGASEYAPTFTVATLGNGDADADE